MTRAEADAEHPRVRAAPGSSLDLIRELIEDRGRRHDFDDQFEQPHDDVQGDPPCPDE